MGSGAYTLRPHLPLPQEVRQVETRQVISEGRLPLFFCSLLSRWGQNLERAGLDGVMDVLPFPRRERSDADNRFAG